MSAPGYRVVIMPKAKVVMDRVLRNWLAITIGRTIIAARPLTDRELEHELVHVAQWDAHGLTFPFRYAWASITALRSGGHWYFDNRFEVEARG